MYAGFDRGDGIWQQSTAGIAWDPSVQAAPPACSGLRPSPSWPLPIRFLLAIEVAQRGLEPMGRKANTKRPQKIPLELRAKTGQPRAGSE